MSNPAIVCESNPGATLAHVAELKESANLIWTLKECRSLVGWDQQVLLPPGGASGRANHMAALNRITHQLLTAHEFGEKLKAAEGEVQEADPDCDDACYVAAVRHAYNIATKMPGKLVEELSRATSASLDCWVTAKERSDFTSFAPHVEKVFGLMRQVAECLGYPEHPYDALLDEYEPGTLSSEVGAVFAALQPRLSRLVEGISRSTCPPSDALLQQDFPLEGQRQVSRYLLGAIGFDLQRGRLDHSAHPFCSTSSSGDIRLTTRSKPDFGSAIFGALHEGGHGLYEQGSPPAFDGTPLRGGCSLGIHESQSRLWENFVGRGLPFWKAHFPYLKSTFPEQLSGYSPLDFYRAVNVVRPSLIRVEADEVTYTLHIILRFEIEKALLTGDIKVADLPAIWNEKMQKYLGVVPPDHARGCLQDIHWADGLVGYFPTYSLGNLIAAMMWETLQREIPLLSHHLECGNTTPVLQWLRNRVHVHASKFKPKQLLLKALGKRLDDQPFMKYLEEKYRPLYGIS